MSPSLITVAYLASAVLFILALGGLSSNESARRGNLFGIIGMLIALVVTIIAFVTRHYEWLVAIMVAGGVIGFILSRRVQMTQMPELVAILHSLVGLAAVLIGIANFLLDFTQAMIMKCAYGRILAILLYQTDIAAVTYHMHC